jgi:serine/threonine-protein kinase HipA
MSAQPNVDAGEIRHNAMKLAMAVGDSRHYTIDTIMPRHFLQTAASSGVSAALVQGILDEIENDTDRAIDAAVNDLPPGFRDGSFHRSLKACAGVCVCSPGYAADLKPL